MLIMTKKDLKTEIIDAILDSTDLDDNSVSLSMFGMFLDDIIDKFIEEIQNR